MCCAYTIDLYKSIYSIVLLSAAEGWPYIDAFIGRWAESTAVAGTIVWRTEKQ